MKTFAVLSTLAIAALAGTASAQVVNLGNLNATSTQQTAAVVVPASGPYSSYTVTLGWVAGANDPYSNEARWQLLNGVTPLVNNSGVGGGALASGAPTNLTWSGLFPAVASGTNLTFNYLQTYPTSNATWNNVTITFGTLTPSLPSSINNLGSINPAGPLTISTGGTLAGSDTVLGLFDSAGNLLGTNDDNLPSAFSQLIGTLANGTYYAAVADYGSAGATGGAGFGFAFQGGTDTGTTTLSVTDGSTTLASAGEALASGGVNWYSFTVVPTPGAAALLGLGGLAMTRRRR